MNKIIFLDRDGVINRDLLGDYVKSWEEFTFLPGSLSAIKKLIDNKYRIFVVSNQAGIAKGKYTLDDLEEMTEKMLDEIESYGGKIEDVIYCPHRDEDKCECRKPKTGMFEQLARKYSLKFNHSKTFFIGDGKMDIEAGKRYGLKTILVLSGKGKKEDIKDWEYKPDYIMKNLKEAVDFLLAKANKNR